MSSSFNPSIDAKLLFTGLDFSTVALQQQHECGPDLTEKAKMYFNPFYSEANIPSENFEHLGNLDIRNIFII